MQQRMFTRASFEFAYWLPRFKQETIWKYDVTELINRFFDILTVQKSLPKVLLDFSTSVLNILFGLILLSIYHSFIFFGLIMVGILLIMFYFTAPHGLRTSINESSQKYKSVYWLEEIAHSLTTFKMAGRTDFVMRETNRLSMGYLNARKASFQGTPVAVYSECDLQNADHGRAADSWWTACHAKRNQYRAVRSGRDHHYHHH